MNLALARVDLALAGATHANTLRVLPSAKRKEQKIVVADQSGVVTCFQIGKRGEFSEVFRYEAGKQEATALTLAGDATSPLFKDNVVVAFGQNLQGFKKKGKLTFKAHASLNENIRCLASDGAKIYASGDYSLSLFKDGQDTLLYMAPDHINHLCVLDDIKGNALAVLGCQDKFIRILDGSTLRLQVPTLGPVTQVIRYRGDARARLRPAATAPSRSRSSDDNRSDSDGDDFAAAAAAALPRETEVEIVYGTSSGIVAQLLIDTAAEPMAVRQGFVISNEARRGGVTALAMADLSQDGVSDVLVGREDGRLEIFSFDVSAEPRVQFARDLGESITSIDAGHIFTMQHLDLVLATHSGKIVAFTHGSDAVPRPALAAAVGGMAAASGAGKGASGGDASAAIRALREEIEKLQERVLKERDKYAALSTSQVAVTTQFKVKSGQRLLPEEACYLLSVEISMPIDVVAIQSSVPVMLLDVPSNVAVVSRSPQDGKNGNEVLATYRCQDNVQRLEIKARTVEGQHGSVAAYVVPKIAPKTCQRIVFQIKPLSLHEKVAQEAIQDAIRTRPLNTLTLTGDFSMPEIHAWLCNCVPDLNPRVTSDDADIFLRSSFLGTVLTGSYRKGHAVFRSDSVTTLLIVKEVLAKEASAKKVVVNPQVEVREESVFSVLEGLRPRLDHHFSLARRRELVAPLKELQAHEEDISFLTPEYQDILKHADDVEREFKEAPRHLDFLRGIVHDLLVDLHKLQGKPVQQKVGALFQVLQNYRYEDLIAVFRQRD